MELLQTITQFNNTEKDCPISAGECKLYFDTDNTRIALKLEFNALRDDIAEAKLDVCCYGGDGYRLTVLKDVPYMAEGMILELPSLMTKAVQIQAKSAVFSDGSIWSGGAEFPDREENEMFGDVTEKYDFSDALPDDIEEFDSFEEEVPGRRLTRAERKERRKQRIAEEKEIRDFIKHDPGERKKRIIKRIIVLAVLVTAAIGGRYVLVYKAEADAAYSKGMNLYNSGKFADAAVVLEEAEKYRFFGEKKDELDWCLAMSNARERNFNKAAVYFKKLDGYKESRENYRSITEAYSGIIAAGKAHTVALRSDGTVAAAGSDEKGQCKVTGWNDIVKLAAGGEHTTAIKRGGTVVAAGDNSKGQCNVKRWSNIIDIAAGGVHTVGVENTGRVVAVGDNSGGQCDVEGWSGIVSIAAGETHTVGLKIDGTVIAAGSNSFGECNVGGWSNIVMVAAGSGFTAGLTYDGKLVFAGDNSRGAADAASVKDAFCISAGSHNIIVTDISGRTRAFGGNDRNQSVTDLWKNIVASAGGETHSVGVALDGTVFGSGSNDSGQISLGSWSGIGLPSGTVTIRKGE
ncbi:MAG: hypothetical protein Q4E94_04390 [Clostridia bacterium]|nr:hypothetical protein [Clostridia bacterium]